jgi:hypothetical protein
MTRFRRVAYLVLALLMGAIAMPAPSYAAKQLACSTSPSSRTCGSVVVVGDPDKPCIERDGKAYCPVYNTYYPVDRA